jgi:hypothetical protein
MAEATTTLDVLVGARALIEKPGTWCIGNQGQDAAGRAVYPYSPKAIRFCALGAVLRTSNSEDMDQPAVVRLAETTGAGFRSDRAYAAVTAYNNGHRHGDVLSWFDRAIQLERAAGAA